MQRPPSRGEQGGFPKGAELPKQLTEEGLELDTLRKANFNLKLYIYHLEEKLKAFNVKIPDLATFIEDNEIDNIKVIIKEILEKELQQERVEWGGKLQRAAQETTDCKSLLTVREREVDALQASQSSLELQLRGAHERHAVLRGEVDDAKRKMNDALNQKVQSEIRFQSERNNLTATIETLTLQVKKLEEMRDRRLRDAEVRSSKIAEDSVAAEQRAGVLSIEVRQLREELEFVYQKEAKFQGALYAMNQKFAEMEIKNQTLLSEVERLKAEADQNDMTNFKLNGSRWATSSERATPELVVVRQPQIVPPAECVACGSLQLQKELLEQRLNQEQRRFQSLQKELTAAEAERKACKAELFTVKNYLK